jgi:hypothetical protein
MTARAKGTDKRGIACRLLSTRLLLELSWQCSGAIHDLAPSRPGFESSSGQVASEWDSCYPSWCYPSRRRTNAPECQPSLPSRSRSAQSGQKTEANSPFVRAFCSSCDVMGPADRRRRRGLGLGLTASELGGLGGGLRLDRYCRAGHSPSAQAGCASAAKDSA